MLAGLAWGRVFPINKNLWTSSFALFSAGLAAQALALFHWLVDVQGWRALVAAARRPTAAIRSPPISSRSASTAS